jgi:ABC-type antimicrobial peptide transport system permease subunit
MVILQGARVAFIGIAIGIAGAFALTRLLSTFLYSVQRHDPAVFVTMPLFLCIVALLSVWLPARRATRVSPVDALRID